MSNNNNNNDRNFQALAVFGHCEVVFLRKIGFFETLPKNFLGEPKNKDHISCFFI